MGVGRTILTMIDVLPELGDATGGRGWDFEMTSIVSDRGQW